MNNGVWALLAGVAIGTSAVAILANSDLTVAVPLSVIAVAAAAVLLLEIVEQTRWPAPRAPTEPAGDPGGVRSSLRAGVRGRFPLVLLIDTLDRRADNPNVRGLSQEEVERLEALPAGQFRTYLAERITDLERRT